MVLDGFEVLLAVARHRSLSAAARELHLSQPSVSERIARLERTVGRPLFVRSNKGVVLTAAGERLLDGAGRSLEAVRRALDVARTEDTEHRLHVTSYASYAAEAAVFTVTAVRDLNCAIAFDDQHSSEAIRRVAHGTTDLAFTLAVPHPHEVAFHPFRSDPVVAVCHPQHTLAAARPSLADLGNHLVAFNRWGTGAGVFIERMRDMPNPSRRLIDTAPAEAVVALARSGNVIGIVARSTARADIASGALVELRVRGLPRWNVDIYLGHRTDRAAEPAIARVLAALDV